MNRYLITLKPSSFQSMLFEKHVKLVRQVYNKLHEIVQSNREKTGKSMTVREMYRVINSLRYQNRGLRVVAAKTLRSLARHYEEYDMVGEDDSFPIELTARATTFDGHTIKLGRRYGFVEVAGSIPSINGYIHRVFLSKQDEKWVLELIVRTVSDIDFAGCIDDPESDEDDDD